MFILIVVSSNSTSKMKTAYGLASASIRRGHRVTIFFFMSGVKLLADKRGAEEPASLIEAGVKLLACRTSVTDQGIESEESIVSGADMSSLGELVELMDRCDRTLYLG